MWMDRETDISSVRAGFDRQRDLIDQIPGVGTDDAATEQTMGLGVKEQLGEAVLASEPASSVLRSRFHGNTPFL